MALGDGIRRNLATVSKEERDLFIDAVKQLNQIYYSPTGSRTDFPAGHVSYWFKQDEIHQSSHVHGCPAFLPWHRELCNRFEALLRTIHPELSLHYWDWNLDPSNMPDGEGGVINLFDANFMGNADGTVNEGSVGEPLLSAGFYLLNPSDPDPADGKFRDNISPVIINKPNPNDPSTWSYPPPPPTQHYNPADPPKTLTRNKQAGPPPIGFPGSRWAKDSDFINANTWENFRDLMYGDEQGTSLNGAHGAAHSYIGGNLANPHLSFRDPFVFLLHSNIDRLWAMWQRQPGHPERLDPAQVYNTEGNTTGHGDVDSGDPFWGILSPLEPWAGFTAQTPATGIITSLLPIRPWYPPENEQNLPENYKTSKDISVVIPPSYDTAPHSSYIIANQDIFSSSQAAVNLTFAKAFYIVYDGFQPREVGTPTVSNPAITFAIGGAPVTTISAGNPQVFLEDPSGAPDVPQRVSILYDIVFANQRVPYNPWSGNCGHDAGDAQLHRGWDERGGHRPLLCDAAAGEPAESLYGGHRPSDTSAGAAKSLLAQHRHQWGNVPRATQATLFFPEVQADQILSLSALRQHPAVLAKVDDNTISVKVADLTFIPLPARLSGNLAGLMTLTLPQGIRVGQVFKMSVQQCSGIAIPRRARRMLGAFQFNIPVNTDPEILPNAIRNLSILRYIQQTVPTANRWYPIFVRWLNGLAAKVAGLGGDPTQVLPSPTGGDTSPTPPCYEPEPCEVSTRDLWCMNIPWDECDFEGEIDLKLRFRKKGK